MFTWILGNTLVAGVVALLIALFAPVHRSRPALAHLLWVLALVVLLMPKLPLFDTPGNGLRRELRDLFLTAEAPVEVAHSEALGNVGPLPAEFALDATTDVELPTFPVDAPALLSGSAAQSSWLPELNGATALSIAQIAWWAGGLALLAYSAFRILRFQRLVGASEPAPQGLRAEVARVAERLGVAAPEVRMLAGVASPSIWCLGRPLLLWPAGTENDRTSNARSAVIAHELAHVARRDHWVSWLEVPAAAFCWWNPLFWLIRGRIRHFAELSCDAWAVWAYPADRRAFAEALIEIQASSVAAPVALEGLGATDSECKDFERRLNMIMKKRAFPRVSKGAAAFAALAAVLVAPGFSDGGSHDGPLTVSTDAGKRPVLELRVEAARWMEKAEALFSKQEYDAAHEAFAHVLQLDPDNGKAHGRMGYLLIGEGAFAEAGEHFIRQYELGENRPTALYNLACAKARAGEKKAALKKVKAAVLHGFGNTQLMADDADLASIRDEPAYQELLELATVANELKYELSMLEGEGEDRDFLELHGELAKICSANGELLAEHGHLALKGKAFKRAAWAFGRQAEIGHEVPTAYYNLACARSLAGDVEGAVLDLERAANEGMRYTAMVKDGDLANVRKSPRYAGLEARIAGEVDELMALKSQVEEGDLAAAAPVLKRIASDEASSLKQRAWAAQALGRMLVQEGRFEDALGTLEYAASLDTAVDRSAFQMAEAYAGLGRDAEALQHVKFAVELGYADAKAVKAVLASNSACTPATVETMVKRAAASKSKSYGKGYGEKKKNAWSAGMKKKKKKWSAGGTAYKQKPLKGDA